MPSIVPFLRALRGDPWPVGARRLTVARALLGGSATAALLPDVVRGLGGDATTCLRLAALFAIGTLASELPAATRGDRIGEARVFLRWAGAVQAAGLAAIACAHSLAALACAVVLVGVGAGLATGAEARAALAIGGDARGVARLEVAALLGKGTVCCAIAVLASLLGAGARGAIAGSAMLAVVAAGLASTLRVGDRVRAVARGRRRASREGAGDRRRWTSFGVIALVCGVSSLTLAARGTDALDAFTVAVRGGGLIACAALVTAKGLIARALSPAIARARLHGVAVAAAIAAIPLVLAPRLPSSWVLPAVAVACGVAGGAAAAARGVLLVRLGSDRVGTGAAIEATIRRVVVAVLAVALAPVASASGGLGAYVVAGAIAVFGGLAVLVPRTVAGLRRGSVGETAAS